MIAFITIIADLIIYAYYGYVWAKIGGEYYNSKKLLFAITGFFITLSTHLLLGILVRHPLGYFVDNFYGTAFIIRHFMEITAILIYAVLILISELYAQLLKRRLNSSGEEIENIGKTP